MPAHGVLHLRPLVGPGPGALQRQGGLSLVELMVSLLLGLLIVGAATTIFLANRSSMRLVEGAARLQENARFAVELMGRDIHEAAGMVCGGDLPQVNIVDATKSLVAWATWDKGLLGNGFGTGTGQLTAPSAATAQIANTDSVMVWSASMGTPVQLVAHDLAGATFTTASNHGFSVGDVVTACDGTQVATFEVASKTAKTVTYTNPSVNGITHTFSPSGTGNQAAGFLNQLSAHAWYVGKSTSGDTSSPNSLRRISMTSMDANTGLSNDEMVENVKSMAITYLTADSWGTPASSYVAAASVTDWTAVVAARVTLTIISPDKLGTDGSASKQLSRDIPFTVGLRRRVQ